MGVFDDDQLVLQTEAAECGLACLAMIARAHGNRQSLAQLRRQFPVSQAGTSLKSMMAIADALGLSARPLRCQLEELGKVALPAVLHWSLDHYVVLVRVTRRHAVILDPATGQRRLLLADVSREFTGVVLELTPAPHFEQRKIVEKVRLSDLWGRLSGLTPLLLQLFVLSLLLQGIGLIAPLSNQLVVDDVIGKGDRSLLNAVLIGFGALLCIQLMLDGLRGLITLYAGQKLSLQLSGNLLRHLLRLPVNFFERRHVGDIVTRFSSLGPVQGFLTGGAISIGLDGLMIVPLAVVMFLYSPVLSILVLVNLATVFLFRTVTFPVNRRFADEQLTLSAKTQSIFLETIRGVRAIKIAGREVDRHTMWQNATAEQLNNAYRQGLFGLWGNAGFGLVQGLQTLLMLYFGALQVMDHKLTLGMFFAFQSYAGQFSGRANGLVAAFFTFRMLGLHLERLADIVQSDPEPGVDGPVALRQRLKGGVSAEGLGFRYSPQDPWVFRDVSFEVERGEAIAIVGPSGEGKSTLLKILVGLYSPEQGVIRIDGHPLAVLGVRAVRDQVGVVMQDDQLLSGTIADNVAFFDPQIDLERVESACRTACVDDDINQMPMGYNSLIGDMGSVLSGGQKQRILLARALYKQPSILLLDEGTANLDIDLERRVMENLSGLAITRIMVAHREAAISVADRVFLIDDGRLVETRRKVESRTAEAAS